MNTAIDIQGVSKRFRLYHKKYSSLKERALHAGHIPYEEFWGLKDVTVEIPAGKTVGILGRNGSGKSTLLKCIAGILQPTDGQVVVRGHLAAMLELGAGFQPELSGRDNIYLNGSLLGLSRKEIARRFDAIVEFAELEQFIDNQVKYYSSGMYVRLGFAVAVNVEPDVLLVDEVLAVGDERFQQKCLERVYDFQKEGRTIVVVSHSPDMLRQICDDIVVLERGELVTVAPPGEAIRLFRDRLIDVGSSLEPNDVDEVVVEDHWPVDSGPVRRQVKITDITVEFPGMDEHPYLETWQPLTVRVSFEVAERIAGVQFGISIFTEKGDMIFSDVGDPSPGGEPLGIGKGSTEFVFHSIPFTDGRFSVGCDVRDLGGVVLDIAAPNADFEVMWPGRSSGAIALAVRVEMNAPGHALPKTAGSNLH